MTVDYTEEIVKLAHEVLMAAGAYTDMQMKEIPLIIKAKTQYFWGNDLNDWEVLQNSLTDEAEGGFCSTWNGYIGPDSVDEMVKSVKKSVGQGDMVPMHFAHNQVVRFIDDRHAQLLTRMHDYHTYKDNEDCYMGYGLYVDDVYKCDDGVWRLSCIRLDKGLEFGSLR